MPGYGTSHMKSETISVNNERLFQFKNNYFSSEELVAVPAAPTATLVGEDLPAPCETSLAMLQPAKNNGSTLMEQHLNLSSCNMLDGSDFAPLLAVKDEPLSEGEAQHASGDEASDSSCSTHEHTTRSVAKSWTQGDMDKALDALKNHHLSLTKASSTYGIPSTTLWQRAHRLGIHTPKKEGASKSWSDEDLKCALDALRNGAISANKASKAYGIPSSTLYKIARREGIRLSAPFNAAPTTWRRADLERALHAIRCGAATVQRAASHYGIPTGTLYGRCKREGIELSRSNPTPWSEDAMGEALEAVRVGQMSINQAAIHFNLPYSSLYGRFKRCKYQPIQEAHQSPVPGCSRPDEAGCLHPSSEFPYCHTPHAVCEGEDPVQLQEHYHAMYYNHCDVTS